MGERRLTLDNGRFSPPPLPTKGAPMTEMRQNDATQFAEKLIVLLLMHQEMPLGSNPLASSSNAKAAAQHIALFRKTLIAELTKS
jgi:hypothetical protein